MSRTVSPVRPRARSPRRSRWSASTRSRGGQWTRKRNLYRAIVANLEPFGIPKNHVKIVLREQPRENWGIRGGQAACDVDLGFKVDV